jgi:drug/metabolite transporter (DMT)-like permease
MPIVLAMLSAAVYGVADYCGGRASRLTASAAVAMIGQAVSGVLVLALVLAIGTPVPDWPTFAWGGAAGAAGALGIACFYHALSRGSMAVVAPVSAVISVALPVIVGLAEGERPKSIAYVGFAAAAVAVALVSGLGSSRGQHVSATVLGFAVAGGIGFGSMFVLLERTDDGSGLWPLVAIRTASVPLLIVIVTVLRPPLRSIPASGLTLIVLSGALDMAANGLYLAAVRGDLLSIVAVVSAMYPVSTVLLAAGLDHERIHRTQIVGMLFGVAALTMVTLGRA